MARYKRKSRRLQIIGLVILVIGLIVGILLIKSPAVFRLKAGGGTFVASVTVSKSTQSKTVSANLWSTNLSEKYTNNSDKYLKEYLGGSLGIDTLKSLGTREIRYPTGCSSAFYDWKTAGLHYKTKEGQEVNSKWLTVDQALNIASQLGSTLYWVVNISTKSYIVSCGQTTLTYSSPEDAASLVRKYRGKIKYFELGNEVQWATGLSRQEYMQTALAFAKAMKAADPSVKISVSGYITNSKDDPNFITWTTDLKKILYQKCGNVNCFDSVTEHPYVHAGFNPNNPQSDTNFPGMLAYYPQLKLKARYSERISEYAPKTLDLTEWNIVCWDHPYVVNTVEHGLFTFENILAMAEAGVPRAQFYALTTTNADIECGITLPNSPTLNPPAQALKLAMPASGGKILDSKIVSPTRTISSGVNCDQNDCYPERSVNIINAHSVINESTKKIYVLLTNRDASETANIDVNITNYLPIGSVKLTVLAGNSFQAKSFNQTNQTLTASPVIKVSLPPASIAQLEVPYTSATPPPATPVSTPPGISPTPIGGGGENSVIAISAMGTPAQGIYPNFSLLINGALVRTYQSTQDLANYVYQHNATLKLGDKIRLVYDNDTWISSAEDRNLKVDKITIDGKTYESESPDTFVSGAWNNTANSCGQGNLEQEWLLCNGYFEFTVK